MMERFTLVLYDSNILSCLQDLNEDFDGGINKIKEFPYLTTVKDSLFLTGITSMQKSFVAYYTFDAIKGDLAKPKCEWIPMSSDFVNEDIDDGSLILYLLTEHFKTLEKPESKERGPDPVYSTDPLGPLHGLADQLPVGGSYILEVICVGGQANFFLPEDCLPFYGLIKRLELWHNARINFFDINELLGSDTTQIINSPAIGIWKDAIKFGTIKKTDRSMTLRPSILWSGDVILHSENGCHTCIPGFELRGNRLCSQSFSSHRNIENESVSRVLIGNEIEVLQAMEIHEIPLHVCCTDHLTLTARDDCEESTKYFFDVVQKATKKGICFLGCVFYDIQNSPIRTVSSLSTKKWFDYVNDKSTEYLVPVDLRDNMSRRCMVVIKGSEYENEVDVIFLKDLDSFDGSSFYNFLCHEHDTMKSSDNLEQNLEWKLKMISEDDVLAANLSYLEELHLNLENPDTDVNDLFFLLTRSLEGEFISIPHQDRCKEREINYCAAKILSPSTWPERLAWSNEETSATATIRGSLKRFQSAENHMKLKGIPVAAENHYEDVAQSVSQIQHLFDEFGGPSNKDLKKIPLVADRLFKQLPPEDDVKALPFSKATQLFGHGIDYCLDSHNSLKLDAKISRIQKRFISDDTGCTLSRIQRSGSRLKRPPKNESQVKTRANNGCLSKRNTSSKKHSKDIVSTNRKKHQQAPSKGKSETDKKKAVRDIIVDDSSCSAEKETRSQRHQRRLRVICEGTLQKYGMMDKKDPVFERCVTRLFTLCKSFLKDLKTSEGLTTEMKRIAKCNVQQVVEFEKRGK